MLVKSVKYWTKKIKTYHLLQHLVFCVRYNIIKDSQHFGPPGIIVTSQSVLKHLVDLSLWLRSAQCLKADWEVTIIPWGPEWCVLFLNQGLSAFKTIPDCWSQIAVFHVTGYYRFTVIKIDSILWPKFRWLWGWSLKSGYFTLLHSMKANHHSCDYQCPNIK